MAHNHENCIEYNCMDGAILGPCDDGEGYCPSGDCTVVGHCDCLCHSGKTCMCGTYSWPRREKQT